MNHLGFYYGDDEDSDEEPEEIPEEAPEEDEYYDY